jgi:hypothetical protein
VGDGEGTTCKTQNSSANMPNKLGNVRGNGGFIYVHIIICEKSKLAKMRTKKDNKKYFGKKRSLAHGT